MSKQCEGRCDYQNECSGEVLRVRVSGGTHLNPSPIDFWYCKTARESDKESGFDVEILEEEN
jgi:hypothetical protein